MRKEFDRHFIADSHVGAGVLHGLKLVAVAIVAQAVMGMARSLCPDRVRASIATVALVVMLIVPWSLMQIATILLGGVASWILCRADVDTTPDDALPMPVRRSFAIGCLIAAWREMISWARATYAAAPRDLAS